MNPQFRRAALAVFAAVLISTCMFAADNPKQSLGIEFDSLDHSVNPCEDFYRFSCGGWRKANPLPADKPALNRYSSMAERNRTIAEGAGATPVAAALAGKAGHGKVVCVVSGGNIDLAKLSKIFAGEL